MFNSKKGNRYSEHFKKQLCELSLKGKSVPSLASEYGIPKGTIHKWFSELKLITRTEKGTLVNRKEMDATGKRIRELEMERLSHLFLWRD